MTHSFPTRRYSDRHSFDLLRKERGLTEEDTPEQLGLRSEQHRESLDLAQRDLRILETVRLNAELEQAKKEESRANERLAAAQERTGRARKAEASAQALHDAARHARSDERRVGKGVVSTGRPR